MYWDIPFLIRTPSPQEMHVTEKPISDCPRMEEKSSERLFCPNSPFHIDHRAHGYYGRLKRN